MKRRFLSLMSPMLFLVPLVNPGLSIPDGAGKANVKGYIKDANSGETLPYANIMIKGTSLGTASNVNGYFVLVNIPVGQCTLRVSYIGYETVELPIVIKPDLEAITVEMKQKILHGNEVVVTAENMQTMKVVDEPAQVRISPQQIKTLPSVGEVDIFRSLQLLPGISAVSDGSSGLYVRGGTPDENLVLFDGMTIYHVDHFFGIFSAFNTDAIKDVRVFKGGFPAKFGGRTSSVVELTGKSGSYDKFHAGANLSLLSASGIVEVPIAERGAWLLSFRRSYTDIIQTGLYKDLYNSVTGQNNGDDSDDTGNTGGLPGSGRRIGQGRFATQQETVIPDFYYYDLNSKFSYSISERDLFSFSLYNGRDNLDQSQDLGNLAFRAPAFSGGDSTANAGIEDVTKWGNIGVSAKWSRGWSDRIYSNFLAAYSVYSSESQSGFTTGTNDQNSVRRAFSSAEDNEVRDFTLRWDNEWQMLQAHKLELGAWYTRTNVDVRFTANDTIDILNRNDEASQLSLYLQDRWRIFSSMELTLGLRATSYEPTQKTYYEPRASLRYSLNENISLKGAWGKYNQFVKRVTNENVLQGNRDFWILANESLEPGFAEHRILGASYENFGFLFDIEAYYKDLDGVSEFSQRFRRLPNTEPEELFFQGTGVAKGIEFLLQKKTGKFNGWASYTLSDVEYTISPLNDGQPYPADQDRAHEFKLVGNYRLGKWNLATTWVYGTGAPYTAPESQYAVELLDGSSRSYIHVSDKNANRLPSYHRLDVSLSRQFSSESLNFDLGLSVYNLYNRMNVWYREYVLDTSPVIVRDVSTLGITPTITFSVGMR